MLRERSAFLPGKEEESFQFREFRENLLHVGGWVYIECTKALGTAARLLCEGPNGRWVMMSTKDCAPSPWYHTQRGIFVGNFVIMSLKHTALPNYRKDHKISRLRDTAVQSVINYYPISLRVDDNARLTLWFIHGGVLWGMRFNLTVDNLIFKWQRFISQSDWAGKLNNYEILHYPLRLTLPACSRGMPPRAWNVREYLIKML